MVVQLMYLDILFLTVYMLSSVFILFCCHYRADDQFKFFVSFLKLWKMISQLCPREEIRDNFKPKKCIYFFHEGATLLTSPCPHYLSNILLSDMRSRNNILSCVQVCTCACFSIYLGLSNLFIFSIKLSWLFS